MSPAALINWDADQVELGGGAADAAIHEASEVSSMIDDALGMTASPGTFPLQHPSSPTMQTRYESPMSTVTRSAGPSPPSAGTYTPTRQPSDMLCIKVLRAASLPQTLGAPNPYVVFDWGSLGKASTHAVLNSTRPVFNSTLRFRSPASQGVSLSDALMKSPPLELLLYSRRESTSDDLLGHVTITDTSCLQPDSRGVVQVQLSIPGEQGHGRDMPFVEFEIHIV